MNCPIQTGHREMLVDYAADALDREVARALEQHMAGCSACRTMAAGHSAVWQALDTWEAPAVSPDFDRRLYRRIENGVRLSWWERMARLFRSMPLRQAVPLTASIALLLMAGLILQHGPTLPGVPQGEIVRAKQVERTLEDLELLRQFGMADSAESGPPHAM